MAHQGGLSSPSNLPTTETDLSLAGKMFYWAAGRCTDYSTVCTLTHLSSAHLTCSNMKTNSRLDSHLTGDRGHHSEQTTIE